MLSIQNIKVPSKSNIIRVLNRIFPWEAFLEQISYEMWYDTRVYFTKSIAVMPHTKVNAIWAEKKQIVYEPSAVGI